MPHIFPRRFLRTRDVLDPTDFNEDIHPVYDLMQGRLDRSNFNAGNLKANLRNHPDSDTPETSGPSVAEGAYFKTYVSHRVAMNFMVAPLLRRPPETRLILWRSMAEPSATT